MTKIWKYFLLFLLLTQSCKERNPDGDSRNLQDERETLLKVNKYLVKKDADAIKGFVKRRGWNMEVTKTGLWYDIYEKGSGKKAETGKKITFAYKEWLLDGTLCYSSDSTGNKSFVIGKGGVERGLEEGVLLLRVGDKARFIMPPHLAFGLVGDEKKIPARAIVVYDINILQIED